MTKAQLIAEISKKTGIERIQVEAIIEAFVNSVKEHLSNKQAISLRGFGSFIIKKRAAKLARNISMNTEIHLPEMHVPSFKPSKQFKDKVRKGVK